MCISMEVTTPRAHQRNADMQTRSRPALGKAKTIADAISMWPGLKSLFYGQDTSSRFCGFYLSFWLKEIENLAWYALTTRSAALRMIWSTSLHWNISGCFCKKVWKFSLLLRACATFGRRDKKTNFGQISRLACTTMTRTWLHKTILTSLRSLGPK